MISKQKAQSNNYEHGKKKRRKGNETEEERNFKCFCGKTYLSYPALYLHKKLKHQGQTESESSKNYHNNEEEKNNQNRQDQHSKDGSIEELVAFVKQCNESFVIKADESNDISNPEVQKKYIGSFPYEWFSQKEDFQPLILNLQQIYENLTEAGEFEEDDADEQQEIKTTKCNKIFALFLAKLSKYLTIEGFKEIAYFITLFRLTLNKVGWNHIKTDVQYGKEYCSEQSGEYCLEACNDFIINSLPEFLKSCSYKNFQCIDTNSMGKSVKLTQYFSAWLFDNNYTHSKLLLSKDE